jgi:hypothetical protein
MKYLLLAFIAVTITSCRTLSPLPHTIVRDPSLIEKCFPASPEKMFRAVHVINATIRGKNSSFIGVTIADISTDRIRATLLSVEGLVLLDAAANKGSITLYRGMQQFTSETFARGLFNDIRFMFFPLQGELIGAKVGVDSSLMCRWINQGRMFEKNSDASGKTTILEYDSDHEIMRRLTLFPPVINGFYKDIRMDSYGGIGYSLSLDLLEAEPLAHADGLFSP